MTAPHGFAGRPKTPLESQRSTVQADVRKCPTCNQHFSGDARFCPFDGDPLEVARAYRPDADPLLGKLVDGRYEVETVLGEGGMGSVYAVRHRALGKRFAMKVMRADLARQGELAARFIQEARATAAIGHPNIVQITDFGELPSGAPYFVMELLDGMPLSKMIRTGGALPAAFAVRALQQTAAALAAAHAAGVIHRDLKPDNIHVTKNDVVKVLDFGVAKMAGQGRLTRKGMVFGTPHYMSPEQASGVDVDHRADIYALGIIMYEMFTGKVPFESDSYMGVLTKHMFMTPEPPSYVDEAARELGALEDVTLRCLEKKPEARYSSMEELIRDIETIVRFDGDQLQILRASSHLKVAPVARALAEELEVPTQDEIAVAVSSDPRPSRLGWVLGAIAALILLAGLLVVLLQDTGRSRVEPVLVPGPPSSVPVVAAPSAAPPETLVVPEDQVPIPLTTATASSHAAAADKLAPVRPRPAVPKAAPPRSQPSPSHTSLGNGELVNPWAK